MNAEAPQKIFIAEQDIVSVQCPKCKMSKEANVSKFKKMETSVTLKVKCPCGNTFPVTLERRKYYRKETKFTGKFTFAPLSGADQTGLVTVMDISKGGLKLKITSAPRFKKDDILEVKFKLDNKNQTEIKKQVYVRNIKGDIVNVEFCSFDTNDSGDKAIGFYLY